MHEKLLAVIPAYNEATKIATVIEEITNIGFKNILVIDDGSKDNTAEIVKSLPVKLIQLHRNYGAGKATAVGFKYAIDNNFEYLITIDADGQHAVEDILKVAQTLIKNPEYDLIIGNRVSNMWKVNLPRFIFNTLTSIALFLLTGHYVKDTQSGLRAFNRNAFTKIKIENNRYEFCFEVTLKAIHFGLRYKEIPIKAIYSDYSLKKGQSIFNAINLFWKLLKIRVYLFKNV